jgi:hypothetical protein
MVYTKKGWANDIVTPFYENVNKGRQNFMTPDQTRCSNAQRNYLQEKCEENINEKNINTLNLK